MRTECGPAKIESEAEVELVSGHNWTRGSILGGNENCRIPEFCEYRPKFVQIRSMEKRTDRWTDENVGLVIRFSFVKNT